MQADLLSTNTGLNLLGPLVCKPKLFEDDRGFFFESWNQISWKNLLAKHGQESLEFVQDNHSRSNRGVLRGLHYQLPPHPQAKLVRCVQGEIFDVVVDLRVDSSTFGQWVGCKLSDENCWQLWVPIGFAHGFLTLSEKAEVLYKTTDFWSRDCERSILWDDMDLSINWPLDQLQDLSPQLSTKDANALRISELSSGELF